MREKKHGQPYKHRGWDGDRDMIINCHTPFQTNYPGNQPLMNLQLI